MNANGFDAFFRDARSSVDVEAIREYWRALRPFYDVGNWLLPVPPWVHRPYEDSGDEAWKTLCRDLRESQTVTPFCIYIHVPFCSSKCDFCDNYSFKLGSRQSKHIQAYVDRLCYEMRLWSQHDSLRKRPVSTMHMGGGTPTFLGESALAQIVECCRACFAVGDDTEWALESTVQALTPSMLQTMQALGFRRLHVGVQSLEDTVRSTIGRRNPAFHVLRTLEATLALGWVVSVDLICGLPGQTLAGFLDGIETLIEIGVNGFSLYELLIYHQNARWCASMGLDDPRRHLSNYWMFMSGANLLEQRGFRKNLFNHWADEQDANIYFTFPTRGEDLLAIGTLADGVFGDYHYRHPRYARYLETARAGLPGLEGGLRRDPMYNRLLPLATAVRSGSIQAALSAELAGYRAPDQTPLRERWLASRLIREDGQGGLVLTPSGSWFTGNLVAELAPALEFSEGLT